MRLDKYLSKAFAISRSDAIELVKKGKVTLNDKIVYKKDTFINENIDIVKYEDKIVEYKEFIYMMLNKPSGYVCATIDNKDKTVIDLLDIKKEVFPVGRLDKDTEGLVILTNDGIYAHKIMNPKKDINKKYYLESLNDITIDDKKLFEEGLEIYDGHKKKFKTKPAKMEILTNKSCYVWISEGKYHQIKKMFFKLNNEVIYLKRLAIGDIILDDKLKTGEYRPFTNKEIELFKMDK